MKFQPGDKVSFINEKQDGVVIANRPGGKVIVQLEDGFDVEVFEKELVKTGFVLPVKKEAAERELGIPAATQNVTLDLTEKGMISMVVAPQSLGAVLTGNVKYYLFNRSVHDLLITVYTKTGRQITGVFRGLIAPEQFTEIFSSSREDLIHVESFIVEGLLFNSRSRPDRHHLRSEIAVFLPDLQTTDKARQGVEAFARKVILNNEIPVTDIQIRDLKEKWDGRTTEREVKELNRKNYQKQGVLVTEKEVDLHIEELTGDIAGLSNAEMLSIQLNRFTEEMNNAMRNHYHRLILIHGVGSGVLKQAIRNELKHYKGVSFKDADPARYGYGATEVNFR